uniref:SFRICE004977.2 n=1 Tax=Spodoptera frugiperda TaxID=7108 RepID=A0A2H1W2A1_SPOFR
MKMIFRFLLCFYIVEFYGAHVHGRTDQEIKAWFFREGMDCNIEHPITPKEMLELKDNKIPDTNNAKCFVACVFKKTGMLDSKGMYDAENSIAMTQKDFANDPKRLEGSKKLLETCKKVNDEAVSDGEKGCERSVLLHKCFVETAPQLGIKLP